MKRLALAILALVLSTSAAAQEDRTARWMTKYDLDANTFTYCVVLGKDGSPWGAPIAGPALIETSGSSTTVTAVTASSGPFTELAVKDIIMVKPSPASEAWNVVTITAKASDDSITVDTAVDWSAGSGFSFQYLKTSCGTDANSGWIDVSGFVFKTMLMEWNQGDLDALQARWECRASAIGSQPVVIYPGESDGCGGGTLASGVCEFATAGETARLGIGDEFPWLECRIGVRYKTTDTADTGSNLESITASVTGRTR